MYLVDGMLNFKLIFLAKRLNGRTEMCLKEAEIRYSDYEALVVIWEHPGIRQADLAQMKTTDRTTAGHTIDRLERFSYVERRKDPADKRAFHLYLTEPVAKLLPQFAVPAIMANLVSALYNIVDQIFIGNQVGYYRNAATNVAFPITTVCMALGMMIGVGSASNFNLELGKGNVKKAHDVAGTAFAALALIGIFLLCAIGVFVHPMLIFFGATDEILSYAECYVKITMWGIPFLMLSVGGNPLIRSDGSPKWSMSCMISGALVNVALDYVFVFVFEWGIAGAAAAIVIGQVISAVFVIAYFPKFKNIRLTAASFRPMHGVQVISTIFFSVIGKAKKGVLLAVTRQVLLLIPCLLAAADTLAFFITMWMIRARFKDIRS